MPSSLIWWHKRGCYTIDRGTKVGAAAGSGDFPGFSEHGILGIALNLALPARLMFVMLASDSEYYFMRIESACLPVAFEDRIACYV
jgi:hypothetical protein